MRSDRRLIDRGTFSYEASAAGLAERYGRGETAHTGLVWWARRPHSAMRALVFSTLCDGGDPRAEALAVALGAGAVPDDEALVDARRLLRAQLGRRPALLDLFAGGATIPQEAALLGCDAQALDSNELAVFLGRTLLERAPAWEPDALAAAVREAGQRVLERLAERTAWAFPLRGRALDGAVGPVTTYLWSHSTRCAGCGYRFLLQKRAWASRRAGRRIALVVGEGEQADLTRVEAVGEGWAPACRWEGRSRSAACPRCAARTEPIRLDACRDELLAVVAAKRGRGKSYHPPPLDAVPTREALRAAERATLARLEVTLPSSRPPRWSGVINPALYGMDTHAALFQARQRYVFLALTEALREEHGRLHDQLGAERARGVTGFLSGLQDQLLDWNGRLSMWIPQNEQVGRGFCGPGLAMLWDYAESDPAARGPANLTDKLERIARGAAEAARVPRAGRAVHGSAQALPYPDGAFDAVVADPPYYDNLSYTALADFFFAWKRLLLAPIEPDLFTTEQTAAAPELVASRHRHGDAAHERYCEGLTAAFREVARVLEPNHGVLSLVFGHSSRDAWESLARAFADAPLTLSSAQPLSIERRQRPRAMRSNAVNTCVVFVARPSPGTKASVSDLEARLARAVAAYDVDALRTAGWAEKDAGLALFAQGVVVLGNVGGLPTASRQEALDALERLVQRRVETYRLARRRSL